jgi:hypothetical protein
MGLIDGRMSMTRLFRFTVLVPVVLVARAWAIGDGVNLASLSGWDIVVAADAIASERYAAEELQRFLAEATGQRLEVVTR